MALNQLDLLSWTPPVPRGKTFDAERDGPRLSEQATRVFQLMRDGQRRTLRQISIETNDPEASISARLRDLRAAGYAVEKEYVGAGLWAYWVKADAA